MNLEYIHKGISRTANGCPRGVLQLLSFSNERLGRSLTLLGSSARIINGLTSSGQPLPCTISKTQTRDVLQHLECWITLIHIMWAVNRFNLILDFNLHLTLWHSLLRVSWVSKSHIELKIKIEILKTKIWKLLLHIWTF